jgi:hypothetical protein
MKNELFRYFILLLSLLYFNSSFGQDLKWLYKIGSVTTDYGIGVTIDPDQNFFDVTNFTGNAFVSNNLNITSRGQEDILIRKSTSLGILQWVKPLAGKGQDLAFSIANDAQRNIFITGTYYDSLYYDNIFILEGNANTQSSFVMKIDTDGKLLWIKKMGSNISVSSKTVTATSTGAIVVSGSFEGSTIFNGERTLNSNGGNDAFVMKMNSVNGDILFLKRIGGGEQEFFSKHRVDSEDNIYLTGDFRQIIDFDPGPGESLINTKGLTDIFLLKLSSAGDFLWAKGYGGIGVDYGQSLTTDKDNNVIITGRFSENVGFGTTSQVLTSKGSTDIFLLKVDKNGNTLWVNGFGDINSDQGSQVIVNQTGVIYLAGIYRGKVDFNPSTSFSNFSQSNGGADAFVSVYNQDGTYNQHFTFGGLANEQLNDIALRNNGELVLVGGFGAFVDFDPGAADVSIISSGGLDEFMVNIFLCINPYLKEFKAVRPEICLGEKVLIQVVEGYLNSATQWSWQRDSCNGITFAAGNFLNIPVTQNTTFYIKGWGGCIVNDPCKTIDIRVFRDSLKYRYFEICEGDTIKVGNKAYTNVGVYVDSLKSKSGCDSVLITELFVKKRYFSAKTIQICPGDTVKVGNSKYTLAGTYTNKFTSIDGCDSTIVTTISVLPISIENFDATICDGSSIVVGNTSYNHAGNFIQKRANTNGCEDILVVNIKVLNKYFTQQKTICQGDSLKVGNKIYKISGIFIDTLISVFGCDSILTTTLKVLSSSSSQRFYSFCQGESVKVGNTIYTSSGNYIDILVNAAGCDSTVYSGVTVFNIPSPVTNDKKICEGDSIKVGSRFYKSNGTYIDTLRSYNNCDSIVNTKLQVYAQNYFVNTEICEGDSVVIRNNKFLNTGLYKISLTNSFGCDSIINLYLFVKKKVARTIEYVICPGDSVLVGPSTYKLSGSYVNIFSGTNGCDSIVTSNIRYNHVTVSRSVIICKGDSLVFNGKSYKDTGVFRDTLKKSDGCDSIIVLNIGVNPSYKIDTVFEICKGSNITVGSSTYFNAGKYTAVLQTNKGCDSIINFTISIKDRINVAFNYSICPGDSIKVGNKSYKNTGSFFDTLQTQYGCDSIVNSIISFNHVTAAFNATICQGDVLMFNGKFYREQGIFRDTIKKIDRCDSIIVLNVFVKPTITIDTAFEICKGTSIKVGNNLYSNSGKFSEILKGTNGCDSIINFEIKVTNFIPVVFVEKDTLRAFPITGAKYQWYQCINNEKVPFLGAELTSFPLFKSGTYSLGITYKSCTFYSDCIDYIRSSAQDEFQDNISVLPNPFGDFIQINVESKARLSIFDMSGRVISISTLTAGNNHLDVGNIPPGIYLFEVINPNGKKYFKRIKI